MSLFLIQNTKGLPEQSLPMNQCVSRWAAYLFPRVPFVLLWGPFKCVTSWSDQTVDPSKSRLSNISVCPVLCIALWCLNNFSAKSQGHLFLEARYSDFFWRIQIVILLIFFEMMNISCFVIAHLHLWQSTSSQLWELHNWTKNYEFFALLHFCQSRPLFQ